MLLNAPGACLRKLKVGGRSRKLHGALVACLGEFVAEVRALRQLGVNRHRRDVLPKKIVDWFSCAILNCSQVG
ncbi:hypothetical protein CDL15_Pgr021072 [Punica granatum]|uniref:Uncharacterized protein n=1 Tax=Punica granatum TaxID=22663 RepID=A0A218WRW1_PUNGR|nr:hypothetical protein CDL15_Pgr021072 [Punica granatum]